MTTPHRKKNCDDEQGSLSIEEIAAEAHRHRPRLSRHGTTPIDDAEVQAAKAPKPPISKHVPSENPSSPGKMRASPSSRGLPAKPPMPQQQHDPHQHDDLDGHDDYDDDLLRRAVADAGRWAYGTVLVEVWVMKKMSLVRPTCGWWLDSAYHTQPCDKLTCQICRLTDSSRPDYEPPAALIPGVGLPGVLWAELVATNRGNNRIIRTNSGRGVASSSGKDATGMFGRIQQAHRDKHAQQDSVGGSSGRKSAKFWNSSFRASFRGGGGLSLPPLGKRRGHRRAATSTDDFVPTVAMGSPDAVDGQSQPQFSTGKGGRGKSNIGMYWHGLDEPYSPFNSSLGDSSSRRDNMIGKASSGRRVRGHKRAVTNIDDAAFAGEAADEELRDLVEDEAPVVAPSVVWRDVKSLAADPDQPWNTRLQLLSSCDLGWAAAVPLRRPGQAPHGLVIYMARSDVDRNRLCSPLNETYLTSAAELISSALLLRGPRHAVVQARHAELSGCLARVRRRILFLLMTGHTLQDVFNGKISVGPSPVAPDSSGKIAPDSLQPDAVSLFLGSSALTVYLAHNVSWFWNRLRTTLAKARGGAVQAPPPFSWRQTFVTFIGVFFTISAMTMLNTRLVEHHGDDAALLLGPFGALSTLLYGLTAAPVSQPRNAILGQTVAIGSVLLLAYIPRFGEMSLEWRAALSTATAVSAMVRLGLTHPPAGAAAMLFALGPDRLKASHLAVLLLAYVIAIFMATVLNNLSDQRQYPTSWGLSPLKPMVYCSFSRESASHQ